MNNLIDRQMAIDKIKEIYEWHDKVKKERIIEHFKQLPPAQLGTNLAEVGTDCISRQSAIGLVDGWFKRIGLNGDICLDGLRTLPSVQPKRAKWIAITSLQKGQITWRDYKCSNCLHHREKPMNYCEVCGAKMER